jgi:LSD1 subclass zinc finger protein
VTLIPFPRRAVNDNDDRQYWTCNACDNGAFLLEYDGGSTVIRCAVCKVDVTPYIAASLPTIGIDLTSA